MAAVLPLIASHLQPFYAKLDFHDAVYDDVRRVNVSPTGEISCSRSSRPYTSAMTPGHTIPPGYTPSGKYKPSKYVPAKTDKRAGK